MHVRRAYLGWGVFFILLGAIPLAVQAGLLTSAQVADWWRFWPLILVGIGLGLLLRRTALDALGGLIVAATFGIMVGAALSAGIGGIGGFPGGVCRPSGDATPFEARAGTFSAGSVSVEMDLDCGDMTLSTDEGIGWRVGGESGSGADPAIEAGGADLSIESNDAGTLGWMGTREHWDVTLPTTPRLDIDAQLDAGTSSVDLSDAAISSFELQLNAGSATVDLGAARTVEDLDIQLNAGALGLTLPATGTSGTIEANAGSVRLCAPPGVALRLQTDSNVLSSFDYDGHGLVHDGSTCRRPASIPQRSAST